MTNDTIEHEILVHRYLYYVEAAPIISDFAYDELERRARKLLPKDSVVHKIGSSLPSSYSQEVIRDAKRRMD